MTSAIDNALPPDVLVPSDTTNKAFNPLDLVTQMLRGFCSPWSQDDTLTPEEETTWDRQASLQPHDVTVSREVSLPSNPTVPSLIQATQSTCSVSEDSMLEDDESDHFVEVGNDDDDTEDIDAEDVDETWVIAETVFGTSRCVRIGKGLEIFACTVALLVVTIWALKRYTHVDVFELQSKLSNPTFFFNTEL